jgi:hypothetical protein
LAIYYALVWTLEQDESAQWICYPPLAAELRNAELAQDQQAELKRQQYRLPQQAISSAHE